MAPKARSRGHPPQAPPPPPQPSDYDTDAPAVPLDVRKPAPRSNEDLNLKVLQRHHAEITDLEWVAPYVVLYTLNEETSVWDKAGIEGTLFICQLQPSPAGAERFCAVILNRHGLNNFYIELTSSEDMEIADPYVIVRSDQIYGIWIFADPPPSSTANSRVETGAKLAEVAERAKASREANESARNGHAIDITEAISAPMDRQLSLQELFNQGRAQDAGFSAHSHNTSLPPSQLQDNQKYSQPNAGPAPQDVLGQLFMKAKQDYNGHG